ncbi:MAG: hypothetical protein JXA54_13275 [Candidatus Heimdallarchaeota archaeon]|nr:hypothetical protein [Candidatus Heimdallarchaeota archaeon]
MSINRNLIINLSILFIFCFVLNAYVNDTQISATSTLLVKSKEVYSNNKKIDDRNVYNVRQSDGSYSEGFSTNFENIGNYGFENPVLIKQNQPTSSAKIAVDGINNAHIFWVGKTGSDWILYHVMRFFENSSWSTIENFGKTDADFKGVLDAEADIFGRVHLVWKNAGQIKYRLYDHLLCTWSNTIVVGYGSELDLAINEDGLPRINFINGVDSYSLTYRYARLKSNMISWEINDIPIGLNFYYANAKNSAFLVTNENGEECTYLFIGTISRTGSYWNPSYYVRYDMVMKENYDSPFTTNNNYIQYNIPSTLYGLPKPQILGTEDDNIHLFYVMPENSETLYLTYQKRDETGKWGTKKTLSDKVTINSQSASDIDNITGKLIFLWTHTIYSTTTQAALYLKSFSPEIKTWSEDISLLNNYNYTQYPDFDIDTDGNMHLIWFDQLDTTRRLYYRIGWADSDEDGLYNFEERNIYGTDPFNPDCDGDQFLDGEEIALGFDPFNPDEDADGMGDGYEYHYGLDPYVNDSYDDLDGDLLLNLEEYQANSFPNNNDSDGDSVSDYLEVKVYFSNPRVIDTDKDKIGDGIEIFILNSNPNSKDSDNDTMDDWYEWVYGLKINENDTLEDLDGDGLINILEYQNGIRPDRPDHDEDGLNDYEEVVIWFTHPINLDTDGDGIWDGPEVHTYGTNPLKKDTDYDKINDNIEILNGLDPCDNDTDDDLMLDGYEWTFGLNPLDNSDNVLDYDNDGLTNYQESLLWTDPFLVDTDGDKFTDLEELSLGCDPTKWDTDGDGLDDYNEIIVLKTNVTNTDTDYDLLNDYLEVHVYNSNPHIQDTDGDTIIDGIEVYVYGTHPRYRDTDFDGIEDNIELIFGSDPTLIDTDFDGMDDYYEWLYNLDPLVDDSFIDSDSDGISNGEEFLYQTNPLVIDTDLDGLSDFEEIAIYFTNPTLIDTDFDGLTDFEEIMIYYTSPHDLDTDDDRISDGEEITLGTNPLASDTDFDGVSDGDEIADGTDPLDATDNKKFVRRCYIMISFSTIIAGVLIYYFSPTLIAKLRREEEITWIREGIKKRKDKSNKIFNNSDDNSTNFGDKSET